MQIVSSQQCKKARASLNMSIYDLAEQSNLDLATIVEIECEDHCNKVSAKSVLAVHDALTKQGIHFIDTHSVKYSPKEYDHRRLINRF